MQGKHPTMRVGQGMSQAEMHMTDAQMQQKMAAERQAMANGKPTSKPK